MSRAICRKCNRVVDVVYEVTQMELQVSGVTVELKAGKCRSCGEICSIPASESSKIAEARRKAQGEK